MLPDDMNGALLPEDPLPRERLKLAEQAAQAELSEAPDDTAIAMDSNDGAPIVRFVNQTILDAVARHASDIHFEPGERGYRVRYRIDGLLHIEATLPSKMAAPVNARLKIMSGMDITERRRCQDGRIRVKIRQNKTVDLRLSSLPTLWGEKLVIRILDAAALQLSIDELGFSQGHKAMYLNALRCNQGLILATGPTGSGKSVSLYSGLQFLNNGQQNISTVEDPVEIHLAGINQTNVNARVGLDFAGALRSLLRQDPDIIMVGEIRDEDTASVAIKAAQTGHLVLSTLHTSSATDAIGRLQDMGIPLYALSAALSLVIAQRLARRLCEHCKTPAPVDHDAWRTAGMSEQMISHARVFEAAGCSHCYQGYQGRIAIVEALPVTKILGRLIRQSASSAELRQHMEAQKLPDLRQAALEKVSQGQTSLTEVERIC